MESAAACQAHCAARPGCSHWTWNSPAAPRFPSACFLKSGGAGARQQVGRVSGPRQCRTARAVKQLEQQQQQCFQPDTNYPGHGIPNNKEPSLMSSCLASLSGRSACSVGCRWKV